MNILLINNNPMVSRLLELCTRDVTVLLEEVRNAEEIRRENYDFMFVDIDSYSSEVSNLSDIINMGKKILLSDSDVRIGDFDMIVKKPFLPSQIINIFEGNVSLDIASDELDEVSFRSLDAYSKEAISKSDTQILNNDELERIKLLLKMDDDIEEIEEDLSDEETRRRKVEAIKEQLIAEGLEIVGEEEIVEELSSEKKIQKKKKKKPLEFSQKELGHIEDAVQVAMATLKRKQIKKLLKGKKVEVTIRLEDIQ